jgi:predicted RNase H-like nuclease
VVRFVGVDLAWGPVNGTGVCALDRTGAVLGSTRLRGDDEIVAWVEPHLAEGALIGIDASLVVVNDAGQRPCEHIASVVFGPREAGPYPTNRAMPHFADGGRAARIVSTLGLPVDPHDPRRRTVRRALEVYPHAAIVALFGLSGSIKYKRGPREERKRAFAELFTHLEGLRSARPALDLTASRDWGRLRHEVETAPTAAALDRAEDEVDAYVCAYVALYYWTWGTERCAVLGEVTTGSIVTPMDDDARRRLARYRPPAREQRPHRVVYGPVPDMPQGGD